MKWLFAFLMFGAMIAKAQGGLDPTFGSNGIVFHQDVNGDPRTITDILIQPNGALVTIGPRAINRFLPSGKLDSSFATNGTALLFRYGAFQSGGPKIVRQIDGKLVAISNDTCGYMVRLNPSGSIDTTFGVNGYAFCTVPYYQSSLDCIQIQNDGKIVLAGQGQNYDVLLARFNSNGKPDSSFGLNGYVSTSNGLFYGNVGSIGFTSDNKIAIGGIGYDANGSRSVMAMRFLNNGVLDTSFNHTGKVYSIQASYCFDMLLYSDGKLLLPVSGLSGDSYLIRLKHDGSFDSSFGQRGFLSIPQIRINRLMWLPDGKVICAGTDESDFRIARIKSDGSALDSSFGLNGTVSTDISATTGRFDRINALVLQSDGKVAAAGEYNNGGAIVRYLPNAKSGISIKSLRQCTVYPNPASSCLIVTTPSSLPKVNYKVYGIDGSLIDDGMIDSRPLDIRRLPPGLYVLSLTADNFSQRIPFIKP